MGVACDVTDPEAIRDMRGRIERELGVVQILAPFAGGQGRPVATVDIGADLWRAVLDSDLTSVYLTTAAFLPGMIERGEYTARSWIVAWPRAALIRWADGRS